MTAPTVPVPVKAVTPTAMHENLWCVCEYLCVKSPVPEAVCVCVFKRVCAQVCSKSGTACVFVHTGSTYRK